MKPKIYENSNIWMDTKRIETLVDGIFAIAMTLLVLSLKTPNIPYPASDDQIVNSLLLMGQQFLIYFHKLLFACILLEL